LVPLLDQADAEQGEDAQIPQQIVVQEPGDHRAERPAPQKADREGWQGTSQSDRRSHR
jgi:hypothetical protein